MEDKEKKVSSKVTKKSSKTTKEIKKRNTKNSVKKTTDKKQVKKTTTSKPKKDIKEEKIEKIIITDVIDKDVDVNHNVKTIFDTKNDEKLEIPLHIKLILLGIIVIFVLLFSLDLFSKKDKFKQTYNKVNNLEKKIEKKLDVNVSIEGIVGKNSELSDFYLNLLGYENSNQVTHPKVIRFKEKWNGYKYWIAYTPYPYGNAAKENPFIMVSNNLVDWVKFPGSKNPLDEPEDKDFTKVYNSDTHLVYVEDTNTLECYWRRVDDKTNKVIIYKRTTKDGIHWTEKEVFLESDRRKEDYLSPAIIYKNKKYLVWYVDRDFKVKFTEYDTEKEKWAEPIVMNINYENDPLSSWHLDVIETKNGYEMILVAFTNWEKRASMNLYYTKSKDNENWDTAKIILRPNQDSGIYRSSILYINNTYYIFYSDIVKKSRRGVSIVYGTNIENLNGLKLKNKERFINYIKTNG